MNIVGLAVPINSLSEDLGGWREMFAASALDGVDAECRLLVNHDAAKVAARRPDTLSVHSDRSGLWIAADADEAISYVGDVVRAIRRKDIRGMSFGFVAENVVWEDHRTEGPIRHVTQAAIRETSIVTWPAYKSTSVSVRSLAPLGYSRTGGRKAMNDKRERLELAAPAPGHKRDAALLELEQALRFWRTHPGREFEIRYAPPPAPAGRDESLRMPSSRTMSTKMTANWQRYIESTL